MTPAPLLWFGVVAVVELIAVAADWAALQWIAKPLLAPLLIAYLVQRGAASRAVVVALVFATAGDIALLVPGRPAFLIGMVFFLGTQISLIVAFARRPVAGAAFAVYGLLWLGVNALLWGQLGALRIPVLFYSLALTVMAATAAGVSRTVAVGGAFFLVSDLLIGVGAAGTRAPAHDILVMSTYCAALALIATGWSRLRARTGVLSARP
ncbi:lysoplasmalogenase [Actinoplanes sp. LDG1-06]|uniref:Lysoplasmalogenase n=1 Tax=Paractinoplanes ovalisporus TaxID=2810368 RepID=A0ABS2AMJ1_9ACTN|nr:lysoplasmalogenase [Actinoplanes ovalisporus]MBM2621073.1 lysoplasmalogenase [Actinoplanes ovalisporus]